MMMILVPEDAGVQLLFSHLRTSKRPKSGKATCRLAGLQPNENRHGVPLYARWLVMLARSLGHSFNVVEVPNDAHTSAFGSDS